MSNFVALRLEGITAEGVVAAAKRLIESAEDPSGSFLVMRVNPLVRTEESKEEDGG